jgi:RNA polymerase sigma-70 factor, ECF subfamily
MLATLFSPAKRAAGSPMGQRDIAQLFGEHGPMVYGRARRLLGSHEDAEEAAQEIFIRVMSGGEALPPAGEVVPWLCRITTNYCLNKLRDRGRRRELFDTRVGPALVEPSTSGPDEWAQARALLAAADQRQAQAAVYVHIDGMSHDEAAEMMGVSRRTVGNLLERFAAWARGGGG